VGRGARISQELLSEGYDRFYRDFDSPLMRQIRREAYGDDIGQHSWVTKQDLESDIARLELTGLSRVLDLGCGVGGLLAFVVGLTRCHGTGLDVSTSAIEAAQKRAASLELETKLTFQQADLNQPLPYGNASFEAAMSFDVVLHLHNRPALFREIRRVLIPGGRFLFTDAGVVTGLVSANEFLARANRGFTQFDPASFDEHVLQETGFEVLDVIDRTSGLAQTASRRMSARLLHESDLRTLEGDAEFEGEQRYLGLVVELSRRSALSRMTYLAQEAT